MARRLTYHKLLHRDGLWRIENFKYLLRQDSTNEPKEDLRIQVVIGKVLEDREQHSTKDLETVPVPIGDLPILRRNRLIRDGYLLREQYRLDKEEKKRLTLDLSPENLTFFNRFDEENSEPIIWKSKYSSHEDSESLYVGIGYNGDPYGVIIPSVDIFLFFYANSTFMTQLVLSESILDPEFSVYDKQLSVKTGKRRKIWLKEDVPEKDARYLAMLLFDNYALEAAQNIYLNRGSEGQSVNHWAIRATPPMKGRVSLKLIGRYMGSRLMVTEITSCDWAPPFDHLEWERDGRSSTTSNGTVSPGTPKKLVNIESPNQLSDGGGDRRTVRSEVREPYIDQRFPRLKKVPVQRSPRPEPKEKEGARYVRKKVPVEVATTAVGGTGPRDDRRAEIRGQEESPADTPQDKKELENIQLDAKDTQDQSITSAILLLAARNQKLATVDLLNPGFASTILLHGEDKASLCLLPGTHEGKDKAWLFSDEDKRKRRVAVIARVEFLGEVRYVFELQMRMQQRISTGLIWREPHSEIQDELLHELLLQIADPAASKALIQSTTQHKLQWGRCKHRTQVDRAHPAKLAEEFLNRLFAAPPINDASD